VSVTPGHTIPYQEIEDGALILLLLRSCSTWEQLCERFEYASPPDIEMNTAAMSLYYQLVEMRDVGLVVFEERMIDGKKALEDIKATELSQRLRVAFGGMSLADAALLSRSASGLAVVPVFGRLRAAERRVDVFVLMPFNDRMESVYTQHIKKLGEELCISIERADDQFSPAPFMDKVWEGIYSARLVIADCTDKNPNVFYEVGIAHTVGRKVVILTRSKKDIPADLQHFEYIEYVYDPEGVTALIDKLREIIKAGLAP